jgi:hypothetical protein
MTANNVQYEMITFFGSLPSVVNFINIFMRAAFLYKELARSFFVLIFWVCTFLARKNIAAKAALKMLVKLTSRFPDLLSARQSNEIQIFVSILVRQSIFRLQTSKTFLVNFLVLTGEIQKTS